MVLQNSSHVHYCLIFYKLLTEIHELLNLIEELQLSFKKSLIKLDFNQTQTFISKKYLEHSFQQT